jgi:aminoglycoside phosphotransferase (APT) family kinase protein
VVQRREPEALATGLARWLREQHDRKVEVTSMARPGAGYAGNTRMVALSDGTRVVLRLPPDGATHLGDPLERQAIAQNALAAAGVPVPSPAWHERDPAWIGSAFVVMPCVDGHVGGEVPVTDEWITDSSLADQTRLYEGFVDALAAVHRLTPEQLGAATAALRGATDRPRDHVDHWRGYLDWATDGAPPGRLVASFERAAATAPTDAPPVSLLWGDPRLGNAIFDDRRGLVALIDWETAGFGPAELDVGYWLGLEAVLDEAMGRRVDGFPTRDQAIDRYQVRLGRPLVELGWWEVLGLLTAACMSVRLSVLAKSRVPTDDELGAHPVVGRVERLQQELQGTT